MHLAPEDSQLLSEVFQTIASLVQELELEKQGYRIITNGGHYQDIQQLHFHLISGNF